MLFAALSVRSPLLCAAGICVALLALRLREPGKKRVAWDSMWGFAGHLTATGKVVHVASVVWAVAWGGEALRELLS